MEMGNKTILGDISLFNTTIAFDRKYKPTTTTIRIVKIIKNFFIS
jgi:hypothetical protein